MPLSKNGTIISKDKRSDFNFRIQENQPDSVQERVVVRKDNNNILNNELDVSRSFQKNNSQDPINQPNDNWK